MEGPIPPRLNLAQTPTPIHKLQRLSNLLEGPEIWIKRDDLTGSTLSGNKIRKLEFVAADALRRGADVLVTCGGIQSNHARATAVVARRLGLHPHLVLRGQAPSGAAEGNLFLDQLLGASITWVTPEQYRNEIETIFEEIRREYEKRGKQAYIIPEGASNELGAFGYLRAAREIVEQMRFQGLEFSHLVTAVGSGGTLTGLLVGRRLYGLGCEVVGFNVCDNAEYFRQRISGILARMSERYHLGLGISRDDIQIIDGYVGRGYALSRPEELALIRDLARLEGVVLDPVYTGKAMFGLLDQIRQGRFGRDAKILFLHTGGIYGLFPKKEEMDLSVEGTPFLDAFVGQ